MCAHAATYYVATNGNDGYSVAQAQNPATPWLTIQKAANSVTAGDTVLIRAGTYRETATVPVSGTSISPITFQAYNNEQVTISGADSVTGWTMESANIWYAPMTWTLGISNQVFVSDAMAPEARWPNAGPNYPWEDSTLAHPSPYSQVGTWSYLDSAGYTSNTNGWFIDAQLPDRADDYWIGAKLFIMSGDGWIIKQPTVLAYTNSLKKIVTDDNNGANSAYVFHGGNEYFLTGKKGELDSAGEWFYDTANSRLYVYSTSAPPAVTAKRRMSGFVLDGRSYLRLVNLGFQACSIKTDSSANVTLDGLDMKYLYHSTAPNPANGTSGLNLRDNYVLRNSELAWDSHGLLSLRGTNCRVINNHIHDGAYVPVFHTSALVASSGIEGNLISHNTIHDSGRACVGGIGRGGIFEYNDVYNAMKMGSDGGVLYSVNGDGGNCIVRYNFLRDTAGVVGHSGVPVLGFYLDSQHNNWILHNNIIWNINGPPIHINSRFNCYMFFNNTVWGAPGKGYLNSSGPTDGETGARFFNNIFSEPPRGNFDVNNPVPWNQTDIRFNRYSDGPYVNPGVDFRLQAGSGAIDAGTVIPGVTDGYLGAAPDQGALEYGGVNWATNVGCNFSSPPSPDPVYSNPGIRFANQVRNSSFERNGFNQWTTAGGTVSVINVDSWGGQKDTRSGAFGVRFTNGTSQVMQTLTNLVSGRRYRFYTGTRSPVAFTSTITLGVTNYGNPVRELTFNPTNVWRMTNMSFVMGMTNTSADIYIKVASSDGTNGIFVDDIGVILKSEFEDAVGSSSALPLAHYKLDETSGLTAYDSSGNGLNATLFDGPATDWTNGIINGALFFNGADRLLTPAMATPPALTIACWAKSVSSNWNASGCLISKRPSFILHPEMGSKTVRLYINTNASSSVNVAWTPPASFDIREWHHYAAVFDPTNKIARLYADGAQVATVAAATGTINPDAGGQIYIGKDDHSSPDRNFIGSMDDVRIYDKALSTAEILALATTNSNSDLRLRLALDDAPGSTIAWDATGLGGTGVLTNMAVASVWTNGILNGALNFDGVNDAVITAPIATPATLTVSCWARSATPNWNADGCLVAHRPAFVLNPIMGTRNVQFLLYTNAANFVAATWTAPAGFDIGEWHHYAGVFDPTIQLATLYVDGVAMASIAAPAVNLDNGSIFVGQDSSGGANRNFNGTIDDVRLYSRALAWGELSDLAFLTTYPYFDMTPASPLTFNASATSASAIALSWTAGDFSQTGYQLDYRPVGGTIWTNLAKPAAGSVGFTNTGLGSATAYEYRLQATNVLGGSGFSTATATTFPVLTPEPLAVTNQGNTNLVFSWAQSGFKLQWQTNSLNAGLSTNWSDYPGGGTSPVNVPLSSTNPAAFFRLKSAVP